MTLRGDDKAILERLAVTTKSHSFLEAVQTWTQSRSIWPFTFGSACCALEYVGFNSKKDGPSVVEFSMETIAPEMSDLLLVAGTITKKQYPILKDIYRQMPMPKWVMAIGACAASGGAYNSYNVVQGIDSEIPVDVYVPGCPPSQDALLEGVQQIRDRIQLGICASKPDENGKGA